MADREHHDTPIDLLSRVGTRALAAPAASPVPQRDDVSLPARLDAPLPPRLDGPLPARRDLERPALIGFDEAPVSTPMPARAPVLPVDDADEPKTAAIPSPRTPPAPGEIDLIATPLPTPDDWHRFELALRRVRGVRQLRTEYYRHGVLKVRVSYDGSERLGAVMRAGVPGYRIRVIGEGRAILQVLVSTDPGGRRPS